MTMHHDNDNATRTPAEHRAAVAAQRAGQGNREPRNRNRGWPTGGRLQRARAFAELDALRRFADDEGTEIAGGFDAANDNTPTGEYERPQISRVDSVMEDLRAEDLIAAWDAGKVKIIGGKIVSADLHGWDTPLGENFQTPRGGENEKVSLNVGYDLPDELPDTQYDVARRMDHEAMRRRLGDETCRMLELACGDATSEEIGEMHGASSKTAERLGVKLVDIAIGKLLAEFARRDAADRAAA
jgi:hypothetical protein